MSLRYLTCLYAVVLTPWLWADAWLYRADLSDEFTAPVIDTQKWMIKHPTYEGRPPGIDSVNNIAIVDGWLNLQVSQAPVEGRYYTASSRLNTELTYGFFEVRARIPEGHTNSAFWLYKWTPTGTREIDIFEMSQGFEHHRNVLMTNYHVFDGDSAKQQAHNTLSKSVKIPLDIDTHRSAHTYGFAWTPDTLTWFVNGNKVREEANLHFHDGMHIVLTAQVHPHWMGLPRHNELPNTFTVDYVRVWEYLPSPTRDALING